MQRGKEEYKLAATSDGKEKKSKKSKGKKDMDDLKKEVDLVSTQTKVKLVCNHLKYLIRAFQPGNTLKSDFLSHFLEVFLT